MTTLFGISNCDTVRKARKWLKASEIEYRFHDYRKDGLIPDQLESWANELGWDNLLNRRGTTWRQLSDEQKTDVDRKKAIQLMLEYPAMIKRPLLDIGSRRELGFSEARYHKLFKIS